MDQSSSGLNRGSMAPRLTKPLAGLGMGMGAV
jgi:hypothetical protein